jgi:hypothetical protein
MFSSCLSVLYFFHAFFVLTQPLAIYHYKILSWKKAGTHGLWGGIYTRLEEAKVLAGVEDGPANLIVSAGHGTGR